MTLWTALARALRLTSEPLQADLGADFATGETGHQPAFSVENGESAALVFSWVYAVAMRRAASLSKLPIRVFRVRGDERELVRGHWLEQLLRRPSSSTHGILFRRDLVCDLILTGNCWSAVLGPGDKVVRPTSLIRLLPKRVEALTDRTGLVAWSYDAGDNRIVYPPNRVLHARMPAFRDGPLSLFGTGFVEPLNTELEAEYHAVRRAKEAMKRGRPDVVISPKNGRTWTEDQRKAVVKRYEALTREGGGAIAASDEAEIKNLSWSLRDMEGAELRQYTREGVLAAGRTPPVAVGLETANFATAREQDLKYWESLQDDAAVFDECFWTELLRLAGEDDMVAETDFGGVRALQTWRTEAVQQASALWLMGIDQSVALESCGLADVAAAQVQAEPVPAPKPTTQPPPAETAQALQAWFGGYRSPPTDVGERGAIWRAWIERVHGPSERNLALATARVLRAQAARVAARLEEAARQRAGEVPFDLMTLLAQIWDEAFENSALQGALEPPIRDAAQAAYDDAAHRVGGVGLDIEWKAVDAQAVAVDRFASSVVDINETTRSVIQEILSKGLEAGESVAEMAGDIQQAAAFSPLRAMRVARTETTRTAGAGSLAAYHDAASAGIALQKQWLAERDQVTRPEHLILDGQTVGLDEQFVIPAGTTANGAVPAQWVGMSASGPGEFAVASLTVNCRCALLPVLSEGAEE